MTEKTVKPHQLIPGTLLKGRYRIEGIIGEGGFGITYSGQDEVLLYEVAIKEYFPGMIATRNTAGSTEIHTLSDEDGEQYEKGKQDFLKEARTLAQFPKDSAIVSVRDFFEENNTVYIVMERLRGEDLRTHLIKNGTMSFTECLELLSPIMTALAHVHEQGLIHRDISPANIMISEDGTAKLLDFGAARAINQNGDLTLSVLLKPGYSPEEQYRSKGLQGPWTDVYSLCATFYRMLTGMQPDDSLQRLLLDELKKPSELGIEIPPKAEKVLMKGLSINGKDRYQSMTELQDAFRDAERNPEVAEEETLEKESPEKGTAPEDDLTDVSAPDPVKSEVPVEKPDKKKKAGLIIGIIAAVIVVAVILRPLALHLNQTGENKTAAAVSASVSSEDAAAESTVSSEASAVKETSVSSAPAVSDDNGKLTKTILWGEFEYSGSSFSAGMKYMDIQTDSGTYNVSAVPYAIAVRPDLDPDVIFLGFKDKFDVSINIYGEYELNDGRLTVTASDNTSWQQAARTSELFALEDDLEFVFGFNAAGDKKYGSLYLTNTDADLYRSYYNCSETNDNRTKAMIRGSLSGSYAFSDLQSVNILYDLNADRSKEAVLTFADGGITTDAKVTNYSEGSNVYISYEHVQREYNGRTETFKESGYIRLDITNNYPYGFVLYDANRNAYCYYQDYSENQVDS